MSTRCLRDLYGRGRSRCGKLTELRPNQQARTWSLLAMQDLIVAGGTIGLTLLMLVYIALADRA